MRHAAGRVHHFEADPRIGERASEAWVREAQARTGAEQDHLGLVGEQGLELAVGEPFEARRRDLGDDRLGVSIRFSRYSVVPMRTHLARDP